MNPEIKKACLENFDLLDSYSIQQAYARAVPAIIHTHYGVWIADELINCYETPEANYQRWVQNVLPRFGTVERYCIRRRLPLWLRFDGKNKIEFYSMLDGLTYTHQAVIAILAYACGVFLPFDNCRMESEIWDARKETARGIEIGICDYVFELVEFKNGKIQINGLTPDMVDKIGELVELCKISAK